MMRVDDLDFLRRLAMISEVCSGGELVLLLLLLLLVDRVV